MIAPYQLNLFNNFAKHWQEITGSELLLLSAQGEILTSFNGKPFADWQEIFKQISRSSKPTFLVYAHQNLLAAPLIHDGQTLGYLLARDAKARDASLLAWGAETIVTQLMDAQALQNMTDELIGAWEQLELIYRVTQKLALASDLVGALRSILHETRKVIHTEDGFVLLQNSESFLRVCALDGNETGYDETLLDNLIQANRVIICNTPAICRSIWPQVPPSVETLLATPLTIINENTQAVIGLINKIDKNFTAGDAKLLASLAQQVATIIKNYLTHQRLIIKERLSRELEIAAEIQSTLLPAKLPQVGGVSLAVSSVPASEVGGDFYDFITIDDRYLTLVIGEVSGQGISAAMLTSVARTLLRVEALRGELPHKIIQQANKVLLPDLQRVGLSISVFVATVDTFEGKLTYANAGQTPTLIYRAETRAIERLEAGSVAIGLSEDQNIEAVTVDLHSGDTLVFYTDGIINAQSPNNDLFGLNRLTYIVEARGNDSPESLQQYIQAEVINFYRQVAIKDDITLLIVKMLPYSELVTPQNISTLIKSVDFLYPADISYLSEISRHVSAICRDLPSLPAGSRGDDFIYLIELAISEICTNIIKHAYAGKKGDIKGQITLLNNGVELDFYDQGAGFDPNSVRTPKADPRELHEGGYGLHIVRQIMDVVSYENQPDRGNHWRLIKFLPHT